MIEKRVLKYCGHYCKKDDHIGQCCNCRTWSKNDCDICNEPLFELTMKTGTVFYEKKRLEDILKQVHEIADIALKHIPSEPPQDMSRQRYDALLEIRGLSK